MSLYRRLLQFLRPHLSLFIRSVAFMLLFALFNGLSVAMVKPFTDLVLKSPGAEVHETAPSPVPAVPHGSDLQHLGKRIDAWWQGLMAGSNRLEALTRFCIALLLVNLLKNIFRYAQSVLGVSVEERIIRDIRNRVFDRYLKLPMSYFSEASTGRLVSLIVNDVNLVRGAVGGVLAKGLRQAFLALSYLAVALWASWKLTLITVLVAPVCVALIELLGRRIRRHGRRSQEHMGDLTTVLDETISGVRIVKAFGLEGDRDRRFRAASSRYARAMTRLEQIGAAAPPLTEVLGMSMGIVMIWYASRDIIAGTGMDPGRFMAFISALFGIMQPIRILSNVNAEVQRGLAAAARLFETIDTPETIVERADAIPLPAPRGEIVFRDVDFSYEPNRPVLVGVHLTARPGEVIGLVGHSGAGKSTLIDLIPRFYDPVRGAVLLDGHDLRDLRVADLRAAIGYVSQDTILFNDTVRVNIGFGRPGAPFEEIVEAARRANAHTFIEAMPKGYDTVIGDRGTKLSGGQRQRIAIARALLKNPPVLLFDEATSALDTESESLVQEAVERLLTNRTTFVIAHRLSTVQRADQILVMEEGRIIERGRHAELLAQDGRYRYLYDLQFNAPLRAGSVTPRADG